MATFESLTKGSRLRVRKGLQLGEQTIPVDFILLNPLEAAGAIERARAFAHSKGVANPTEDDALYEIGLQAHVLTLALLDADSTDAAPKPFFSSAEQILTSDVMTPDVVAHWFELYEAFVDEHGVRAKTVSDTQLFELISKSAGGDMLPFLRLRPGTRWACFRTLAALLLNSQQVKSASTSPSSTESQPQASQ